MDILKIKGRPDKHYSIVTGGLNITSFLNPALPSEEHISFENIKSDRFFHVEKSPFLLIGAGITTLIYFLILGESLKNNDKVLFISLTWPVLATGLIVSYFLLQRKVFFLKTFTGKNIGFSIKNNELEVADFVNSLFEKRNSYLKAMYGTANAQLSYDGQYSNFSILLRDSIITESEYQEKIDQLNAIFERSSPRQIFDNYSRN